MSLGALWNNGYFLSYPVIIVFSELKFRIVTGSRQRKKDVDERCHVSNRDDRAGCGLVAEQSELAAGGALAVDTRPGGCRYRDPIARWRDQVIDRRRTAADTGRRDVVFASLLLRR